MTTDSVLLQPSRIVSNNTSGTVSADIAVPQQYETSKFLNSEKFPFTLQTGDSVKIGVPVSISGDKIYTGDDKWSYLESREEALPAATSDYHSAFDVAPHTKATIAIYVVRRKISTGYIATFKERQTGKILKVEGEWKGVQLDRFYTSARWDEIK
ncbi:hypothetical protein GCM10023143_04530 [Compostibacter hankyongensis]|uniref:Uncharacterized protein n=1 Tax=Compostibacter hankyongensis TaxID=1007089 RepID=A0ABP8FEY1_9BACT